MQQGSTKLYEQYQAARGRSKKAQSARLAEALAAHRRRVQRARVAYKAQRTIIGLTRRNTVNTVMLHLHRVQPESESRGQLRHLPDRTERPLPGSKAFGLERLADGPGRERQQGCDDAPAIPPSQAVFGFSPPLPQHYDHLPALLPIQCTTRLPPRPVNDHVPVSRRPDLPTKGPPPRAPLPARPDYGQRPSLGLRILRRAAALLQSGLGKSGRRTPARPLASVRDVSSLDVVHDRPGTEMLLRTDEPDRLGSEIGRDADPAMRRPGNGAVGTGSEKREGGRQSSGQSEPPKVVDPLARSSLRHPQRHAAGTGKNAAKIIERAKGWTKEQVIQLNSWNTAAV